MLSSKRTGFAFVLLATATFVLLVGAIDGAQWLDLMRLLVTTLLVSHTVSHGIEVAGRRASISPTISADLPVAQVVPPA